MTLVTQTKTIHLKEIIAQEFFLYRILRIYHIINELIGMNISIQFQLDSFQSFDRI